MLIRGLIRFNRGLLGMPVGWQVWVGLLGVVNLVVPLFYVGRPEARLVLIAFAVAALIMWMLAGLDGFTRLLGLGHFVWFPLLYFLWHRLPEIPAADLYGLWVRALIGLNGLSLLLDVTDVIRYLAGDRAEVVPTGDARSGDGTASGAGSG